MQTKGWTFLWALLNKFGQKLNAQQFQNMFLKDLSSEETSTILKNATANREPELALRFKESSLDYIHYTWLKSSLLRLPPYLQSPILNLLPKEQKLKLSEITCITAEEKEPSGASRRFLLNLFFKETDAESVLPKELLSPTPLSKLLDLKKEELIALIDLLSMHDLAEEMRQIVDNKKIKAIYLSLKPHQMRHLYLCLHQQEKLSSPPLDLGGWNGQAESLQKKLHLRGLIRLSKALSGQHTDFIWHITHTLDMGRGKVLEQNIQPEAIPKVTPILQQQVMQTINYLSSKSKP